MKRAAPALVAVSLGLWPEVAAACSTCMDPTEGNRTLLWVTIVLSLLPLGMMAAIGGFFWTRLRRAEAVAPALPPLERP